MILVANIFFPRKVSFLERFSDVLRKQCRRGYEYVQTQGAFVQSVMLGSRKIATRVANILFLATKNCIHQADVTCKPGLNGCYWLQSNFQLKTVKVHRI